jgi:membrane-associated protein
MDTFVDYFLHLDVHLTEFVTLYGPWIYALLFLIVFAETGLVLTPFLPGDSLLFAAGAMAAAGALDIILLIALLSAAAILGDGVNYAIGRAVGPRVFRAGTRDGFWSRALNREHLDRAHAFFERYGGKAIVMGRFAPIIRTFVPFVAGAVSMTYSKFALYNVAGGIIWVLVCTGAGYAFGNVPVVKDNFSLVAIGIVIVSLLPMAIELLRTRTRTGPA